MTLKQRESASTRVYVWYRIFRWEKNPRCSDLLINLPLGYVIDIWPEMLTELQRLDPGGDYGFYICRLDPWLLPLLCKLRQIVQWFEGDK